MIFSREGHFALVQLRAGLPSIAARSRAQGTAEENKAIVEGSIAYFGRYALNEADTALTQDELKFANPRTPSGATLEVVWKRAR